MAYRRDDDYDRSGWDSRARAGRRSAEIQDRDEYGRFAGYPGSRSGHSEAEPWGGRGGYSPSPRDDFAYGRGRADAYEGRAEGGRRSAHMRERDEYDRSAGHGGGWGGPARYRDEVDYGEGVRRGDGGRYARSGYDSGGRYGGAPDRDYTRESWEWSQGRGRGVPGSYRDDDYGRGRGSYEGRSEGGRRSSHMQDRDEYGRFAGYGGHGRAGYEGEYAQRGGWHGRDDDEWRGRDPYEGRSEGGRRSAAMQERDEYGRFAGHRGGEEDDRGRGSYEGRAEGGRRSAQMQERDEYGRFAGHGERGRWRHE